MTRKHYEALAAALRAARPKPGDWNDTDAAHTTWEHTVRNISEALRNDNANFNASRFRAACTN